MIYENWSMLPLLIVTSILLRWSVLEPISKILLSKILVMLGRQGLCNMVYVVPKCMHSVIFQLACFWHLLLVLTWYCSFNEYIHRLVSNFRLSAGHDEGSIIRSRTVVILGFHKQYNKEGSTFKLIFLKKGDFFMYMSSHIYLLVNKCLGNGCWITLLILSMFKTTFWAESSNQSVSIHLRTSEKKRYWYFEEIFTYRYGDGPFLSDSLVFPSKLNIANQVKHRTLKRSFCIKYFDFFFNF